MLHEFTAALPEQRMPHHSEDRTNQLTQGGNIFKVELIHIFVFVQMILFSIRSDLGANLVAGIIAFPVSFSFTPSFMLMRGKR